ncbi:hypothetical protein ACN38_g5169 [Penicillium nordicum]|uniref:Uncharacterized protein n=1 Tax=Penicillium nordicum TaxID=229535 RepID=A0A0M8P994_9EURO|nr:hypothetical protein ACN38_g5169 [Penicillium nordicum]
MFPRSNLIRDPRFLEVSESLDNRFQGFRFTLLEHGVVEVHRRGGSGYYASSTCMAQCIPSYLCAPKKKKEKKKKKS